MDEEDYQSVADSFASEQPSTLISSQHCFGKTWSVLGIFRKLTDRSQDPEHQTLLSRMCGEGLGTRLVCHMHESGWSCFDHVTKLLTKLREVGTIWERPGMVRN